MINSLAKKLLFDITIKKAKAYLSGDNGELNVVLGSTGKLIGYI